jgi:hypothetical protein
VTRGESGGVLASFGWALIVSGASGAMGGLCGTVWGPAMNESGVLYPAGGLLVVAGLAAIVVSARSESIPGMGVSAPDLPADSSPAGVARMIELAEMQLVALTMARSDINGRAMGLLAFNGVIATLVVTGRDQIGRHVTIVLIALGLCILVSALATVGRAEVGPSPSRYLVELSASPDLASDIALLTRLNKDIDNATADAWISRRLIAGALVLTVFALGYAAVLALLSKGAHGHYFLQISL